MFRSCTMMIMFMCPHSTVMPTKQLRKVNEPLDLINYFTVYTTFLAVAKNEGKTLHTQVHPGQACMIRA